MLCKSDKPSIIIIIMTVGGMGFIPERLLMMMMMTTINISMAACPGEGEQQKA